MIFGKGETSFHVRESETVLDPGFHTVDFGFQVMDLQSFQVELGFQFLIVSRILDSLSCIPGSKIQDSGFHKEKISPINKHKFLGFGNPDSRTWGGGTGTVCNSVSKSFVVHNRVDWICPVPMQFHSPGFLIIYGVCLQQQLQNDAVFSAWRHSSTNIDVTWCARWQMARLCCWYCIWALQG